MSAVEVDEIQLEDGPCVDAYAGIDRDDDPSTWTTDP
jgi:hypothetical protein